MNMKGWDDAIVLIPSLSHVRLCARRSGYSLVAHGLQQHAISYYQHRRHKIE